MFCNGVKCRAIDNAIGFAAIIEELSINNSVYDGMFIHPARRFWILYTLWALPHQDNIQQTYLINVHVFVQELWHQFLVEIPILVVLHYTEPIFSSHILNYRVLDSTADGGGAFAYLERSVRRVLGDVEILTKLKESSLSVSNNSRCSHAFFQHSFIQLSTSCSSSSGKAYSVQMRIWNSRCAASVTLLTSPGRSRTRKDAVDRFLGRSSSSISVGASSVCWASWPSVLEHGGGFDNSDRVELPEICDFFRFAPMTYTWEGKRTGLENMKVRATHLRCSAT